MKSLSIPMLSLLATGLACASLTADEQELADAVGRFSINLYGQMGEFNKANPSYVCSPLSIHAVLGMLLLGARGETFNELVETIETQKIQDTHKVYQMVMGKLTHDTDPVTLEMANGLFLNQKFQINSDFKRDVELKYKGTADYLDFAAEGGPEKKVNDFVDENTNGVIKELFQKGSISGDTVAVLVNTLFFNGTWENQFSKYATRKANFTNTLNQIVEVDMMREMFNVNLLNDEVNKLDILELPFEGGRFSLYIVLPRDINSFMGVDDKLSEVLDLLDDVKPVRNVNIRIPKFKIETKADLENYLKMMGMKNSFQAGKADFSNLSQNPTHISKVIHKAVIEVQETGTVAAAATGVSVKTTSFKVPKGEFIADRPFLFFLKDKLTDLILFQGKFTGEK